MDTVRIDSGLVSGVASADVAVHAYLGIPYAAPPVGALRWRVPQPVARWDGVRPAKTFGPRCVQPERLATSVHYFGTEAQSEDCLTLNVWTGARAPDERLPVLVWIHGGAYYQGSGSAPVYGGANLARAGAVVVTINYRLGRLGFLAHPELSAESARGVSGNYGWLDQIAALQWVQRNIAAFGGDPGRVTLLGQSVGAGCVSAFMASPLCRDLFQRAVGQSGAALGLSGRAGGTSFAPLDAAERAGVDFTRALGASSIAEMRAKPAELIQLARPETGWTITPVVDPSQVGHAARDIAWPIMDGHVLTELPRDTFARGAQNDVPLLTGANGDEDSLMFPLAGSLRAFAERAHAEYGDMAPAFLGHYRAGNDTEALAAGRLARGDETFVAQNWIWARMQALTGRAKAYHYRFTRIPDMPGRERLRAFHGAEIPYIFRNLDVRQWNWQAYDRTLSDAMSGYWLNFARSGNPNGAGLPEWPAFDPRNDATMMFGDTIGAAPVPERAKLAFWDAYCERRPQAAAPAA